MATTSLHSRFVGSPYHGQALANNEIRLLTINSVTVNYKSTKPTSTSPEWWDSAVTKMKERGRKIIRRPSNISIELETHRHELTEYLDFDAVSYVWGAAPASVMVTCNNKPLLITPAAYKMLQYLYLYQHRTKTEQRKIWIDAICINQDDKEEKINQIPLMRGVYFFSTSVIIWMGPPTDETDIFFAEFQDVRKKSEEWVAQWLIRPAHSDLLEAGLPCDEIGFSAGLSQLLRNEWFKRLWTYQESILPPKATLLCGTSWADFDEFLNLIDDGISRTLYLTRMKAMAEDAEVDIATRACYSINFYRNPNTQKQRANTLKPNNIARDLNQLRYRRVKEPVDRVWAVTGLLHRDLSDSMTCEVDYSEQGRMEYWKTWIMFAKALIDKPGGICLLNIPPTLDPRPSNLPSWCPNLSGKLSCDGRIESSWSGEIRKDIHVDHWAIFEENSEAKCAARTEAIKCHDKQSISTSNHDNLLRIRGFVLDIIEEIAEHGEVLDIACSDYDRDCEEHMALYNLAVGRHMDALDLARRVYYGKSKGVTDVPDDFIIALFLDDRITEEAKDVYREVLAQLSSWHLAPHSKPMKGLTHQQAQCNGLVEGMRGHTFFSTKGGRIGYAHPGCKPGDQVAAFYGGEPLYIIRQLNPTKDDIDSTGQASDHVQYMGAAFIPHLMEQHQRDAAHLGPDTMFIIH